MATWRGAFCAACSARCCACSDAERGAGRPVGARLSGGFDWPKRWRRAPGRAGRNLVELFVRNFVFFGQRTIARHIGLGLGVVGSQLRALSPRRLIVALRRGDTGLRADNSGLRVRDVVLLVASVTGTLGCSDKVCRSGLQQLAARLFHGDLIVARVELDHDFAGLRPPGFPPHKRQSQCRRSGQRFRWCGRPHRIVGAFKMALMQPPQRAGNRHHNQGAEDNDHFRSG